MVKVAGAVGCSRDQKSPEADFIVGVLMQLSFVDEELRQKVSIRATLRTFFIISNYFFPKYST